MTFSINATARYIRVSPRKARLVLDLVRGQSVEKALAILEHTPNGAAKPAYKLIESAAANADENYGLAKDELFVAEIAADEGPRLKRGRFAARGRFKPEIRRTCHLRVGLREVAPVPLMDEDA